MEEVVVLEVRIGVATHTCGAGGGRLQADELAAAIQDKVAPGENGCMTPHAADHGGINYLFKVQYYWQLDLLNT